MSDALEQRLAQFRATKSRTNASTTNTKPLNASNILDSIRRRFSSEERNNMKENDCKIGLLCDENEGDVDDDHEDELPVDDIDEDRPLFDWDRRQTVIFGIKVVIYVLGQTIAFLLQFGAVFFSIALLIFICTNLRNRSKRKGELSAYSVFNPNCKPIHGTVSAKDLENQLTFGALHHI